MRLFVGLDMSLAKTAICVINEHGKVVKETQVASEPEPNPHPGGRHRPCKTA